jgi:hypothetical protein
MDSPKVMVNIISGIHGSMGPVWLTANTGESQAPLVDRAQLGRAQN